MNRKPGQHYFCPSCNDSLLVSFAAELVRCPCGAWLEVHRDADYVNGLWKDLTKLVARQAKKAK